MDFGSLFCSTRLVAAAKAVRYWPCSKAGWAGSVPRLPAAADASPLAAGAFGFAAGGDGFGLAARACGTAFCAKDCCGKTNVNSAGSASAAANLVMALRIIALVILALVMTPARRDVRPLAARLPRLLAAATRSSRRAR